MTDCAALLDVRTVESGRAQNAQDAVLELKAQFRALDDRGVALDALGSELEVMVGEINDAIRALQADQLQDRIDRFTEIDELIAAIDDRLNEIQAVLDGGADAQPAPPDLVPVLFAEAQRLGEERDELLAEQLLLTSGAGDPGGRQPAIDARTAELAETVGLLEESRRERAATSDAMIANHAAQEEQLERQRSALAAVGRAEAEGAAAGCDWVEVDPGPEDPGPEDPAPDDDGDEDPGGEDDTDDPGGEDDTGEDDDEEDDDEEDSGGGAQR